jgi:hypothetical protein
MQMWGCENEFLKCSMLERAANDSLWLPHKKILFGEDLGEATIMLTQ